MRTTIGAQRAGWAPSFNVAFRAGSVMGFALTGMAILVLYVALWGYRQYFGDDVSGRRSGGGGVRGGRGGGVGGRELILVAMRGVFCGQLSLYLCT